MRSNKQKNRSKTDANNISEESMTTFIKPMKPVYIGDLRLIRTYDKKTKTKAATKKKNYQVKKRICPHCGLLTKSLNSHLLQHIGRCAFHYTYLR